MTLEEKFRATEALLKKKESDTIDMIRLKAAEGQDVQHLGVRLSVIVDLIKEIERLDAKPRRQALPKYERY